MCFINATRDTVCRAIIEEHYSQAIGEGKVDQCNMDVHVHGVDTAHDSAQNKRR